MSGKNRFSAELILNIIIVILTVIGVAFMLSGNPEEGALQASGLENLKFYTVLTNVFCGLIALVYLIIILLGKDAEKIRVLKLAAVCGVAITFAVVAFMFGPLYGYPQFYKRGNLFFHLLLPLTAMVEFIVVSRPKMPFRYCVFAAVPTLLYGLGYMVNILINGMGGQASDVQIHAEELLKTKEKLNRILADNTGKTLEQITADTDRDNFLTAEEAKEYGLIDKVIVKRA